MEDLNSILNTVEVLFQEYITLTDLLFIIEAYYKDNNKKAQFALRAKITALHNQLAFEGKGVRVKSVVILQGALNTRKQCKYCFFLGEWD